MDKYEKWEKHIIRFPHHKNLERVRERVTREAKLAKKRSPYMNGIYLEPILDHLGRETDTDYKLPAQFVLHGMV